MNPFSFFFPITLGVFHSKVNGEIRVVETTGDKILYAGEVLQSGGTITQMWKKVADEVKSRRRHIWSCLVMGVGGGTVIKFLKKKYPDCEITGVDIDPVMLEAGRRYFDLDSYSNVQFVVDDIRHWIKTSGKKKKFDLIVIDLYIGSLHPQATREEDFLKKTRKLLKSDGSIVYACQYQNQDTLEYEKFVKRSKKIFSKVEEIFVYPFNRVLLLQ